MTMRRPSGSKTHPSVLDLFAGAGGFSLGFHWAGFHSAIALDHDPVAVETLRVNFGDFGQKAFVRDLASLQPSELRRTLQELGLVSQFDVVVGGPPCQGWSQVGRGKLRSLRKAAGTEGGEFSDPRNELYKRFLAFVSEFQPSVAVMENVPGMLSHNRDNVAAKVKTAFEACGYAVSVSLLNAADYGVPQTRERLFFVGVRRDLGIEFSFPTPTTPQGTGPTVWDAIGDLPPIANGSREWLMAYTGQRRRSAYAVRMRKSAAHGTVSDHVCRDQNEQDLEAFRTLRQGGWYRDLPAHLKRYRDDIFEDKYKKLYQHRPSWCLTAHLSRDCYTHIHPTQARTISIREAARLQSFPDCFYLAGNMGDRFRLIGNAVAPLVARSIAIAIKSQVFSSWRIERKPQMRSEPVPISAA